MSLPDAVLGIAEQMEKDAAEFTANGAHIVLRSFARELRTAVKAAEGMAAPGYIGTMTNPEAGMFSHRSQIEAAKAEFRKKAGKEEEDSELMVEVSGGPSDGTHSVVSSQMPVGAKMGLTGAVYVLERAGGVVRLVYSEDETRKATAPQVVLA